MKNYYYSLFLFFIFIVLSIPAAETITLADYKTRKIRVTIQGEVNNPGLLFLPPYSTLEDALAKAEPKENADLNTLNPAMVLKDRDLIIVPVRKLTERISINTASENELTLLNGIGPATARSIIEYRNTHGFFQSLEDLTKVKGIGPKTLEKIREQIRL